MGAATCIFHQSQKYREKHAGFEFPDLQGFIKGMILDSPFTDLPQNIKNFVSSKASKVPGFMVDFALSLIESRRG